MAGFRPPAPAEIASKGFRFLITDRPSDATMETYLQVRSIDFQRVCLVTILVIKVRSIWVKFRQESHAWHVPRVIWSVCFPFQELKKHGVTDVVRVCEPSYDTAALQGVGITVRVSNKYWMEEDTKPYVQAIRLFDVATLFGFVWVCFRHKDQHSFSASECLGWELEIIVRFQYCTYPLCMSTLETQVDFSFWPGLGEYRSLHSYASAETFMILYIWVLQYFLEREA